ncbi:flagellar assembly protein FliH [Alteribacter lacisalsi]|uniref:Flagellar assembly protein FliH n=2 Tax=Alteribacter lacisalsi TaxID=2045244 RepID=A0A2W0HWD6_9BACI|nr:flagellar assembly protein FliH [Alteribacter lacisalsi]
MDKRKISLRPVITPENSEEQDHRSLGGRTHMLIRAEETVDAAERKAASLIRQAENQLSDALKEAEAIRIEAERKAEALFQDMKKHGYQEGYKAGKKEAHSACGSLFEEAERTVHLSKQAYNSKLTSSEPVLLELAAAVSANIIGEALEQNEKWVSFVKTAVEEVKERKEVAIYVHPERYEQTLLHKHEFDQIASRANDLMIYPDPELDRDGCLLETESGRVDAGLDSQLSELKKQLHDLLERGERDGRQPAR